MSWKIFYTVVAQNGDSETVQRAGLEARQVAPSLTQRQAKRLQRLAARAKRLECVDAMDLETQPLCLAAGDALAEPSLHSCIVDIVNKKHACL